MEETASLKKGEKQNSQVISLHEAYILTGMSMLAQRLLPY
jgi:hypothetical protein